VDTGGAGEVAVFLHARSGTSESWVHQVPVFVEAGYRCVAYDRRDSGRSRPDPAGEQPGYGCDDLLGLIDLLRIRRFHMIATAAGGAVALDFAISYPHRLRSMVVADAVGRIQDSDYVALQQRMRPPEIEALPIELRELSAGYRGLNPDGTRQWLEIAQASHWEGFHQVSQPTRNEMTLAKLETIQVPTLMLAGAAELLVPPASVRILAGRIPGCTFEAVPEAGHAAFWENPHDWNRIVLEFLRRHHSGSD
jgi:pimeloyl-ACP methyl ester carboxylesterase